jgi:hypothetical protein
MTELLFLVSTEGGWNYRDLSCLDRVGQEEATPAASARVPGTERDDLRSQYCEATIGLTKVQ